MDLVKRQSAFTLITKDSLGVLILSPDLLELHVGNKPTFGGPLELESIVSSKRMVLARLINIHCARKP